MSSFSLHTLLARRILRDKGNRFSRPIVHLSVIGVSLGLLIMMMAIGITSGYKREIRDKVIAMGSHIRITHYDRNYSFEQIPIDKNQVFLTSLKRNPEIVGFQNFATKVGIVKTSNQVEGIVLKGVDETFNWQLFQPNLVLGKTLDLKDNMPSNQIIISQRMADKLRLKVGDKVRTYFVQDPPRQRSFTIAGIYSTGLPEYDDQIAIVDLRQVQKLNDWMPNQVGGIEVLIRHYDQIDDMGEYIHQHINYNLKAETIKQIYPEIFEWIALFDTNVAVLLIITTCVCLVTMMSIFFIIILEQTTTIGVLKALGMKTKHIVHSFVLVAADILFKGMLIGDAIAIVFGVLQQHFHFIKLNPDTYYVDFVPVHFNIPMVLLLNIVVFILCLAVLIIPAWVVSKKITPVNAIRYD